LKEAERLGYEYETVKKNVINSKHNRYSTLYYLLQNKMIREKELEEEHEGAYVLEWEAEEEKQRV
jgi:hypothetical protein